MKDFKILKSPEPAIIQEEMKAYEVSWKCQKGHLNWATVLGKEGTQVEHDICLKCGKYYEFTIQK